MDSLLEYIKGTPGYATGLKLSASDLVLVKNSISQHLIARIEQIAPDKLDLFTSTQLEMYHSISDQLPHGELLTRQSRILPQSAVAIVRGTSLFNQLESLLGPVDISDEENIGRESISIRLVRPNVDTDVGSLHADNWFWKLYNFSIPEDKRRIKIWIAICCESGKSGLMLSPNSHLREWNYDVIQKAGMAKPMLSAEEKPELYVFKSNPGDAVIFNYQLLHGGMVSRGDLTRVSIEFTILLPNTVYTD